MHFARETAGAARTRLSLRPLLSRRVKDDANLGRIAPRERERLSEAGAYPKMFSLFENCLPPPSSLHTVIPGRRAAASPESITTVGSMDSGPAPKRRVPE